MINQTQQKDRVHLEPETIGGESVEEIRKFSFEEPSKYARAVDIAFPLLDQPNGMARDNWILFQNLAKYIITNSSTDPFELYNMKVSYEKVLIPRFGSARFNAPERRRGMKDDKKAERLQAISTIFDAISFAEEHIKELEEWSKGDEKAAKTVFAKIVNEDLLNYTPTKILKLLIERLQEN